MRFAVLARSWTPTNVGLASCPPLGAESAILTPAEALLELGPGDVALARLDVLESLDRIEPGLGALHRLEERGVRVLNKAPAILAAHDKLLTARLLLGAGIAHPPTVHVARPDQEVALDPPVVVKPRFGSWGADVVRCNDFPDAAVVIQNHDLSREAICKVRLWLFNFRFQRDCVVDQHFSEVGLACKVSQRLLLIEISLELARGFLHAAATKEGPA